MIGTPKGFLWTARIEGLSVLALFFVAMPMKYIFGDPSLIRPVGMIHGMLFLAYVMQLMLTGAELKWSAKWFIIGFLASSVPFGTFVFERKAPGIMDGEALPKAA